MDNHLLFLWPLNIILESLPISSSGHLKLLTTYLKKAPSISSTTEHLMHIPNAFIIGFFLLNHHLIVTSSSGFSAPQLLIAVAITNGITGSFYLLKEKFKPQLTPLPFGFFISACALLFLYILPYGSLHSISPLHALIIGLVQTVALLPGVSRMAVTTVSGIALGIDPKISFLFSLGCELLLIGVAVAVALYKNNTEQFYELLSKKQLLLVCLSLVISYAALELSLQGFLTKFIVFFGWYLLGLSITCTLYASHNTAS